MLTRLADARRRPPRETHHPFVGHKNEPWIIFPRSQDTTSPSITVTRLVCPAPRPPTMVHLSRVDSMPQQSDDLLSKEVRKLHIEAATDNDNFTTSVYGSKFAAQDVSITFHSSSCFISCILEYNILGSVAELTS